MTCNLFDNFQCFFFCFCACVWSKSYWHVCFEFCCVLLQITVYDLIRLDACNWSSYVTGWLAALSKWCVHEHNISESSRSKISQHTVYHGLNQQWTASRPWFIEIDWLLFCRQLSLFVLFIVFLVCPSRICISLCVHAFTNGRNPPYWHIHNECRTQHCKHKSHIIALFPL